MVADADKARITCNVFKLEPLLTLVTIVMITTLSMPEFHFE
jgi:hypothetical protein